jgi:hypothetical protein
MKDIKFTGPLIIYLFGNMPHFSKRLCSQEEFWIES